MLVLVVFAGFVLSLIVMGITGAVIDHVKRPIHHQPRRRYVAARPHPGHQTRRDLLIAHRQHHRALVW